MRSRVRDEHAQWMALTPIKLVVICVGFYVIWSFVQLFIGNHLVAKVSQRIFEVSRVDHAFLEYVDAHQGRFPPFRTSQDVTHILAPIFAKMAAEVDDEGRQRISLERLKTTSNQAIWNPALSGAEVERSYNSAGPWVFFCELDENRYLVGSTKMGDSVDTIIGKDNLATVIGQR